MRHASLRLAREIVRGETLSKIKVAQALRFVDTIGGLMKCDVPEFKANEYTGLRSGIGKSRKSSKHFGCLKSCCEKGTK